MIELGVPLKEDVQLITEMMTRAFNYDTETYFGIGETGGPPGYNDGTLAQKILNSQNLETRFILQQQVKVGFITLDLSKRELAYFCLLPAYINRGIGSRTWQLIEERFGKEDWQVETPAYSVGNHHFYEKLGFVKVQEKTYTHEAIAYLYKKGS